MRTLSHRILRRLAAITLLAASALRVAPSAGATVPISPKNATYVGAVSGTDAFVAVVTDGHEARAYLCDSASVSVWFGAALDGKAFAADSEGISLQGLVSAGSVRGTVTLPDGTAHRFTAAKTTRTGKAGLFRGELVQDGKTYVGGWIVLPSLKVRGFVEQDNIVVTHVPSSGSGIIAILIGRRALDLPGIGTLQITDGTSNTRR